MSTTLFEPFMPLLSIFGPIVLGISIGLLSRSTFASGARRDTVAQWCEAVALKLLLPFFIIEAVARNQLTSSLVFAFVAGLLLPILSFALTVGCQRVVPVESKVSAIHNPAFPYLVGTFGGGNRGTALFMLLLYLSPNFPKHLAWFSAVDLGNFLCQYTVIALLMQRAFSGPTLSANKWKLLLGNYAVIALLGVLAFLVLWRFVPVVEVLLHETIQFRKLLFGVLVFAALTIRFDYRAISRTLLPDLALFAALRFVIVVLFVAVLSFFLPASLSLVLSRPCKSPTPRKNTGPAG